MPLVRKSGHLKNRGCCEARIHSFICLSVAVVAAINQHHCVVSMCGFVGD